MEQYQENSKLYRRVVDVQTVLAHLIKMQYAEVVEVVEILEEEANGEG
jgi:hypothetical protein